MDSLVVQGQRFLDAVAELLMIESEGISHGDIRFKGYTHHASKVDPQYIIKSLKTDHIAIHKATALKRVHGRTKR